jgi:protein Tob/BTG
MKVEINSAADFLMNLLRVRQQDTLTETQLHSFRGSLITVLNEKFRDHWYIENPRKGEPQLPFSLFFRRIISIFSKFQLFNYSFVCVCARYLGSGFRCIRVNTEIADPCITKAAKDCRISALTIRDLLPQEITLWIDPATVCYRIGENGSISCLYDANRSSPSNSLESSESEDRCEISPEINKLVLDLYEKSNNSIITKPKRYMKNHTRQQQNNSPPKYYSFYNHHQSPSNNQYYQNKAF